MLVAGGSVALGACGGGAEPPADLTLDEPSSSASATDPATDDADADGGTGDDAPTDRIPKDPVDGEFLEGRSIARSDAEQAVAETWFGYWDEVIRMYRTQEQDRDTLYSLATDTAASGPLDYLDDMVAAGNTQRGGMIGAIESVKVDGRTAVVAGCFRDDTQDVNAAGDPVEQPARFFQTQDTLVKEGPDWRVTEAKSLPEVQGAPCRYR